MPKYILLLFLFLTTTLIADELVLLDHLGKAKKGDFLVIAHGKNYTILLVQNKEDSLLSFEEITAPSALLPRPMPSWREWITYGAPGNTSWLHYQINTTTGEMTQIYSYTQNTWCQIPSEENILSSLLNLTFQRIPDRERKRLGARSNSGSFDSQRLWQPRMVVDGQIQEGVLFDAWRTRWPKDGSELAGKVIDIYLPEESNLYPSYFPYWLQVTGLVGKAKMQIVDSGSNVSGKGGFTPLDPHQRASGPFGNPE